MDTWTATQCGLSILSTLEKCILRLKRPHRLRSYLLDVKSAEQTLREIEADEYATLLEAFEKPIHDFLKTKHDNCSNADEEFKLSDDNDESRKSVTEMCKTCNAWAKLFRLVYFALSFHQ